MATSELNTAVEIFTGVVQENYSLADYYGTNSGRYFPTMSAEVLNQPIVAHGDPRFFADDQLHSFTSSQMVAAEIPLFTVLKARDTVTYQRQVERPDLGLLNNYGQAQGRSIAEWKTRFITMFLAKVATTAGNIVYINSNATDGTAPSNVKNGFKELGGLMDLGSVPAMDRRVMLKSNAWYELADQDGVMSKDFGTGGGNRAFAGGNNDGLRYLNFDIKNLGLTFGTDWTATTDSRVTDMDIPAAIAADMTEVIGVAWHPAAWALREQQLPTGAIDPIADFQIWQILTRYQFGLADLIESITINADFGSTYAEGIYVLMEET